MMNFLEALKIQAPRGLKDVYRVQDLDGKYHGFYSAEEANKAFPGAFDQHPDHDEQAA